MQDNQKRADRGTYSGTFLNSLFWFLVLMYLEFMLHVTFFDSFSVEFLYNIGFTAAFALIFSGTAGIFPVRANKVISSVVVILLCVLFCSQIVYTAVFGSMYSVAVVSLGGEAFASFWRESLLTMAENFPYLVIMLLPIPIAVVLAAKCEPVFRVRRNITVVAQILVGVLIHCILVTSLAAGGTEDYSAYYYYHSPDATTGQCAERFGLLTTMHLELAAAGREEDSLSEFSPEMPVVENVVDKTSDTDAEEETEFPSEPQISEPVFNSLEIDFDYLDSLTEDESIRQLNSYISALAPSAQNEYTGMLADYNLITICAESFDTGAIQKDLTPTLYRLSHEGFIFENYFNSYPNITTEGEYSFCLGLLPDISRAREASSFYASRNNLLPYALGNVFSWQSGIDTYAYHNYDGNYYCRNMTHPNMGYKCKFANAGMRFTSSWPSSDLEMMEQSVADYIGTGKPFHAYYMTFSGHFKYSRAVNPMAARNYDTVNQLGLDISEASKCYLSCNYELEKAMTYLMSELEKAGIADKTAIVLAGDHFPYGLQDEQYAELVDHDLVGLNKYRSTLIFWVGGMETPVHVKDYMCNIDILPTILNLWGFEYDSRLLNGTDIFSDAEHIAVLRDKSFLNDKVWINASTGSVEWRATSEYVSDDYIEGLKIKVKNMFSAGSTILGKAYYDYLSGTGGVDFGERSSDDNN